MNPWFSSKKLIRIVLSGVAVLTLIAVSLNFGNTVFNQGVNDVTALVGRIVAYPANGMRNFAESIDSLVNTYNENRELKQKIETVYELEVQLNDLKKDNEQMKKALRLEDTLNEYDLINATVIARNPDNWLNKITINKGSVDGVEVNMSVMSANGLVGRVIAVNPTSAEIALLSNADNNIVRVAAMIQTTGEPVYGTITDYDENNSLLVMSQIKSDAKISIGDKVATSGLGGISPSSLYIGEVQEVTMDRYGLYQQVKIKPASNTNDIRYVTVIKRVSESGDR